MLMLPPLPHSPSSWARVFKTFLFSLIVAFQEAKVGVCVCVPPPSPPRSHRCRGHCHRDPGRPRKSHTAGEPQRFRVRDRARICPRSWLSSRFSPLAPGASCPACPEVWAGRSHGVCSQNARGRAAGGRAGRWTNRSKVRHPGAPDRAWPSAP